MAEAKVIFQKALQYFASGDIVNAEKYGLEANESSEASAETEKFLGNIYLAQGNTEKAKQAYNRCIELESNHIGATCNLGLISLMENDYEQAILLYSKSLQLSPQLYQALRGLGVAYKKTGQLERAEKTLLKSIKYMPQGGDSYIQLAESLYMLNRNSEALGWLNKDIEMQNRDTLEKALLQKGIILHAERQINEAFECFKSVISNYPNSHNAYECAAMLSLEINQLDNAEIFAKKAIELEGNKSKLLAVLSLVSLRKCNSDKALDYSQMATEINNNELLALYANALSLKALGNHDEAYKALDSAYRCDPTNEAVLVQRWVFAKNLCDYSLANKINSGGLLNSLKNTSLLINTFLHELTEVYDLKTQSISVKRRIKWVSSCMQTLGYPNKYYTLKSKSNLQENPNKNIIIGLVGGDFRNHSAARFIFAFIKAISKNNGSIYAYSTAEYPADPFQNLFKNKCDVFRNVMGKNALQLQSLIASDKVDVLIDLSGYTNGSCIGLFGLRSAPIQILWLGYPGSTYFKNLDYIIGDRYLTPNESFHTPQKILQLEHSFVCFDPNEYPTFEIDPILPQFRNGFITFGSLQNPYKFTTKTLDLWFRSISDIKDAKLLLVHQAYSSKLLQQNILEKADTYFIDPERIDFIDNSKDDSMYLYYYNLIDISLDTYPLTGGTSSLDSLWMGVPIITLNGDLIHQRLTSSVLQHINKPAWIANSEQEFLSKVKDMAHDPEGRKLNKAQLRNSLIKSALTDTERFGSSFLQEVNKKLTYLLE